MLKVIINIGAEAYKPIKHEVISGMLVIYLFIIRIVHEVHYLKKIQIYTKKHKIIRKIHKKLHKIT